MRTKQRVLGLLFAASLCSPAKASLEGQEAQTELTRAHRALEAGRRAEAERRFRALIQKEPFRTEGHLGLAEAIAAQGRRLEAGRVLVELAGELIQASEDETARDVLEQAARYYPGSREAHL